MAKEQFIERHVGPRPEDVEEMLKVIGVKSVDELIEQTVPESIRLKEPLDLPAPLSEDEFWHASMLWLPRTNCTALLSVRAIMTRLLLP